MTVEQAANIDNYLVQEAISDVINISKLNDYDIAKKFISDKFIVVSKEDLKSKEQDGWVSSEVLPELEKITYEDGSIHEQLSITVIVYDAEEDDVYPASYCKGIGFDNGNKNITKWQYLPSKPKTS